MCHLDYFIFNCILFSILAWKRGKGRNLCSFEIFYFQTPNYFAFMFRSLSLGLLSTLFYRKGFFIFIFTIFTFIVSLLELGNIVGKFSSCFSLYFVILEILVQALLFFFFWFKDFFLNFYVCIPTFGPVCFVLVYVFHFVGLGIFFLFYLDLDF